MAKAWTPGNKSASLVPPGFNPRPPIPGAPSYQDRHPTLYRWAKHVKPMIHKLYREMGGPSQIHVNTYLDHPEGFHRTLTSLDVWGGGGRNDPIGHAKGQRAFNLIWNDPGLPSSTGLSGSGGSVSALSGSSRSRSETMSSNSMTIMSTLRF